MKEINTLYVEKQSVNTGYIFFDSFAKAIKCKKVLEALYIKKVEFVIKADGKYYYGFRMFGIRRRLYILCVQLKEVLD